MILPIESGPNVVSITFSRRAGGPSLAEYCLDDELVSRVENVGVPFDKQGVSHTGIYPSLGPGEALADKVDNVSIGHGLFSLLDAIPFQHPGRPRAVGMGPGPGAPVWAGSKSEVRQIRRYHKGR